jgi:hypothetical protein
VLGELLVARMSDFDYPALTFKMALTTGVQNKDAQGMAGLLQAVQGGIQANLQESGIPAPIGFMGMLRFEPILEKVKKNGINPDDDAKAMFDQVSLLSLTEFQLMRLAEVLLEKYAPKPKIDDVVIIIDGAAGGPVVIGMEAQKKAEKEARKKATNDYLTAFDNAAEARDEKDALADRIKEKEEELRLLKAAYERAVRKLERAEREEAATEREFKRYRNT